MRVLFVLPYVPSPIRVRPYHFVRELAQRHQVTVLATCQQHELGDVAPLRALCHAVEVVPLSLRSSLVNCTRAVFFGEPLQASFCRSVELRQRMHDLIESRNYHLVHIEHLRAAWVRDCLPESLPSLYDSVDCISLLLERTMRASHSPRQRALAALELQRTRAYESRLLRRFRQVVVTSPEDGRALLSLAPDARVAVLPNGVDLQHFHPLPGEREPATLVLSGKMSYHANVSAVLHFVRHILPLIRQTRPEVRLRVVGSAPPPAVLALGRDPAITVTGYLPDTREAIGRATVAICPITVKVGIQNKVLEAMALGLPVVCTREGAEGLSAIPGEHLLVADNAEEFARHVCALLDDAALRDRLGQAGRSYVETHHQWPAAAQKLEALYESLTA